MSNVLFVIQPYNGHVNPTLGLVDELVGQGEQVAYFCSEEYRTRIEGAGATFRSYGETEFYPRNFRNASKGLGAALLNDSPRSHNVRSMQPALNVFPSDLSENKIMRKSLVNYIDQMLKLNEETIPIIMKQIEDEKFDYMIVSPQFPLGKLISLILGIPTISSFAAIVSISQRLKKIALGDQLRELFSDVYSGFADRLYRNYHVKAPANIFDLFGIKSDLNIAYTSKDFIPHPENYDNSFIFIGPSIYDRKEKVDFPFEKLADEKVVYISLGTVYNGTDRKLYDIFFKTFADTDVVVVMTAYNMDISKFNIPKNFIVRNYVPQSKILKYTAVAITHAGMNSMSDLIYNGIPFVAIPIGADQPYQAARVSELGAAISLDKDKVTPETLRDAVEKVQADPSYLENIKKISHSFKKAGGYKYAVKEIFAFKERRGIDC